MTAVSARAQNGARPARLGAWAWFLIGVSAALLLQWHQVFSTGQGLAMTLRVGDTSPARTVIEAELGEVPVTRGAGHDGQYYYLIARDPLAKGGNAERVDHGGYRYRRILYPALAGGFGLLGPRPTLVGLSLWAVLGTGLAAAAVLDLSNTLPARRWALVGVLANPGIWLSVQLVTADALGLALALWGMALARRRLLIQASVALVAAALTKEQFLAVALGLAAWYWLEGRRRWAVTVAALPTAALVLWSGYVTVAIGQGFAPRPNFGIPFGGVASALLSWQGGHDAVHTTLALGGALLAVVALFRARDRFLTSVTLPWIGLATFASPLIWGDGNNALRVFAFLWVAAGLGLGTYMARSTSARNLPV